MTAPAAFPGSRGSAIRFDRSGSGAPLVLLHGIGSRRGVFEPVTRLLALHHDVIAVDLPGFGESAGGSAGAGGVEQLADAVEALLDGLGLSHFHVVGSSMGGGIALELAARGRALSVTAFAPIGFWGRPGLLWVRALIRGLRAVAGLARPVLPVLTRTAVGRVVLFGAFYGRPAALDPERGLADVDGLLGATGVEAALDGFGRWVPRSTAALRAVPLTIVWGSRDLVLSPRTQAARARRVLPWARHVTLPGSGHLPFADDPVSCLEQVLGTTRAEARSGP